MNFFNTCIFITASQDSRVKLTFISSRIYGSQQTTLVEPGLQPGEASYLFLHDLHGVYKSSFYMINIDTNTDLQCLRCVWIEKEYMIWKYTNHVQTENICSLTWYLKTAEDYFCQVCFITKYTSVTIACILELWVCA